MAERPRSTLRRSPDKAAPVQSSGTGVRGPSPVKEQHLPPGVEMGRNGPEHRPGSETPHPLPRSGRRAGRKSLTLTPPPSPSPSAFRPSRPLPSLPSQSAGGREPGVTREVVSPPTMARWGGAKRKEVWLEEEEGEERGEKREVREKGRGGGAEAGAGGRVRHDVIKKHPYIPAPGRHLGLSRLGVGIP